MWSEAPLLFEDENEEALKAEFVSLWARHAERSPIEIGNYVFRNLRDNEVRGMQAGMFWSKDLDILERVRKAKANGGEEPTPIPSKEIRLKQIQAIAEDVSIPAKERIAAARLVAEMSGEIVKAIDKKVDDTGRRKFKAPIHMLYPEQ